METKKAKKASLEGLKGIFFECGLIVGLFFMIVAFSWSSEGPSGILADLDKGKVKVEDDVPITNPDDATPPPPEIKMPEVSDDIQIVDNTIDVTSHTFFNPENMKAPVEVREYVRPTQSKPETLFDEPDVKYEVVQEKPTFMGGDANTFSGWVSSKIVYPSADQDNGVQGRVILQFRISADGTLENIKVLRSISPGLDKEAVRVVSSSPKWGPGKNNNKPVGVIYTFPVNFVLSN